MFRTLPRLPVPSTNSLKRPPLPLDRTMHQSFQRIETLAHVQPHSAYPIPGLEYYIDSDASAEALGSIISQVQDGHERVISYYSRSFMKAERNYCVTRRELLAIVDSVNEIFQPRSPISMMTRNPVLV